MHQFLYEYQFLKSLLLTVTIESFVLVAVVKYYFKKEYKLKTFLFAGIVPSLTTLPYAWFLFPLLFPHNHMGYVYFTEVSVTLIESYMIAFILKLPILRGFIVSVSANMSSFLFGLFFWRL